MTYTTECHVCGEPISLRSATIAEVEEHGYDADPFEPVQEYLIGTCRKRTHADGSRTHYGHVTTLIHITDAEARN